VSEEALAVLGGQPVRSRPWPAWPRATQSTRAALQDVLESGRWTLSGPFDGRECYERRFARAFADFSEVPFCTPTSSGTAALTAALQALGVGRGDEVLVPGLTWVACASAVANLGGIPVLVDVDPDTLAMSHIQARAACSPRTAAILVVHLFCGVADLDAFVALSQETGLPLIEDCAQAHGARWRGRPVGTFGAAGCFSMQQSKLLTSGEGGAVITCDAGLHDRVEQLRCDGRRFSDAPERGHLELIEVGSVQGRNLCLSEFQAAVLLDGLTRLAEENETRADRVRYLEETLAGLPGVSTLPRDPRVTTRTYYNYVLRLDPDAFAGATVDAISLALSAELGTPVNPVYVPLNRHRLLCPANIPRGSTADAEIASLDPGRYSLPEAECARRSCVTLTHPVLLADLASMDDIGRAIGKVQRNADDLSKLSQEESALAF
jgi:dTDP-4-amino-4,6-dideoxygalactose transaminase